MERIISQKYVIEINKLPIVFGKFEINEFLKLEQLFNQRRVCS